MTNSTKDLERHGLVKITVKRNGKTLRARVTKELFDDKAALSEYLDYKLGNGCAQ